MKVQNEMSTRISVDAVAAIGSMSAFRNAIRGASDAWRAQETALRNAGNYTEAAKTRLSGLNQVIDLQKAKVEELRQRQEGLDTSNKKQANQFLKLEKQIQQANKQLASYEGQAERARNAVRYQSSGLAALQRSYRLSTSASNAFVNRLKAEGKTASATVERYRQLRSSLSNLEDQYRRQESLLRQVAAESGRDSEAYIKQREQLDKTATSIAKTRNEMRSLAGENARLQPTGIKRIDSAVVKLGDHTSAMRSRMTAAFDAIKSHALGISTTIMSVGAALVSSANKAAGVQKVMVENQNLMTTAGEKSAAAQREVNQMYADGEKYSVQYGYSQKTIAQGYQELIKRGYDGRQSLGAMKSILEAARASGDSFDDTMKVTTSTLEAFGMRSETTAGMMRNTAKAADTLAKAADVTSTNFQSIGEGMTYAGSSAKASGVSLRETAAILGVLSNNGLEATQAGTGLQRILSRLAAPTSTAKSELKKYNMSIDEFKDKSGKLKPIAGIFQDINKHVPKAERLEFFNKVFGQTAQNAASILSRTAGLNRENSQSLQHVEDQLKTAYSEDYVGKLARKNMNSAKNSQDRFKYAAQAIQIEIGRNMLPAISRASQGMANAFGRKDTQQGLKVLAKGIGDVANAFVGFVTFLGKHTTTVKVFGTALLAAFGGAKLLDAIGTTRRRLGELRNVLSKMPKVKTTTFKVNKLQSTKDLMAYNRQLDKIPNTKSTHVKLESRNAAKGVQQVNRELNKVPKKKTTNVTVNSKNAVKNINAVGTASKTAAKTSKISFASIKTAGVTSLRAVGLAIKANPIGALITGIQLAVTAFKLLYDHSKRFRSFCNGLGSAAKKAGSAIGKWFSSAYKSVTKAHQQANRNQEKANKESSRNWNNFHRTVSKGVSNFWKQYQRTEQRSQRNSQKNWQNFSKSISKFNGSLWKSITRGTSNGFKSIQRATANGSKSVLGAYQRMHRGTSRELQRMAKEHPKTFGAMYKVMEDRSSLWKDITTGHWDRLGDDTARLAKDQSSANRSIFSAMYDKLNDLTGGGLDTIRDTWNKVLNSIHDTVVNIGHTIHEAWDNLMNGIIDVFGGLVNGIIDGINWILNKVGGDGHLSRFKFKHFANGSNGPIAKRQMAVLNDAPDADYREMVHKHATGKTFMLPAKRNIVMPLEPGDEVLDGKKTAQMMSLMGLPHYAHGSIGSFFSGIFDKVGDAIDDATDWVEKALKNVVEFGKELFHHFTRAVSPKTTDYLGTHLKDSLPGFFAEHLKAWFKKQLDKLNTADPPGTGVARWRPLVLRALHMLGLSSSLVGKVLRQIQTESGGNPKARQPGADPDGDGSGPALGLMQTKRGIFNTYAVGNHRNIWNGFDNLLAGLNYAKHRYGSGLSALGNGHGYANGGYVTQHGVYEMAEGNNPEVVIPLDGSKRGRAYSLLMSVLSQFKREDGAAGDGADSKQLAIMNRKFDAVLSQNQQLIGLLDKLIGVTDSANNPTARYKRTQRDINLAHAQSLI